MASLVMAHAVPGIRRKDLLAVLSGFVVGAIAGIGHATLALIAAGLTVLH